MRLLALLLLLLPLGAFAQSASSTGQIAGRVTDGATGDGLIGATVVLVGTTLGAATDHEGRYVIREVPPGSYTVQISYLGYVTEEYVEVEVHAGYTRELSTWLGTSDNLIICYVGPWEPPLVPRGPFASRVVSVESEDLGWWRSR